MNRPVAWLLLLLFAAPLLAVEESFQPAGFHAMSTPELLAILGELDALPDRLGGAFRALSFSGDPAAIGGLDELLAKAGDSARAVSYLRVLGHIGHPRAVPVVANRLHSKNARVVDTARSVLSELLGYAAAQEFQRAIDWMETKAEVSFEDPKFCERLRSARPREGSRPIPAMPVQARTALTRFVVRLCPDAATNPMPTLPQTPEAYAKEALEALSKPDAEGRADEIYGRLSDYGQDGVPVLRQALVTARDAPLRRYAVSILAKLGGKRSKHQYGRPVVEPDFVLERVEALSEALDDEDDSVRLAAVTGIAELVESQGDGMYMSTGYRRVRFRKALREFVAPLAALLSGGGPAAEMAEKALRAMRLPEATDAIAAARAKPAKQ